MTPFYAAWTWREFAAAKYLARRGADVNFRNPKTGETAYEYGVRRTYDQAMLRWLAEKSG